MEYRVNQLFDFLVSLLVGRSFVRFGSGFSFRIRFFSLFSSLLRLSALLIQFRIKIYCVCVYLYGRVNESATEKERMVRLLLRW